MSPRRHQRCYWIHCNASFRQATVLKACKRWVRRHPFSPRADQVGGLDVFKASFSNVFTKDLVAAAVTALNRLRKCSVAVHVVLSVVADVP